MKIVEKNHGPGVNKHPSLLLPSYNLEPTQIQSVFLVHGVEWGVHIYLDLVRE